MRLPRPTDTTTNENGFTLVEMLVTTALLSIVLAIVLPLVYGSLNAFTNTQTRSDAIDNAELALNQINHDVVSSNLLYITPGATPVVHLQTYGTAASSICVEYQVVYPATGAQEGVLQRRTKAPGAAISTYSGWGNVMSGIVNSSEPVVAPATAPPAVFTQSSTGQSLIVDLWVQLDTRTSPTPAAPENFTSTYTGSAIPANSASFATSTSEPC